MIEIFEFGCSIKKGSAWIGPSDRFPGAEVINCVHCKERAVVPFQWRTRPRVGLFVDKPGTIDDIESVWSNNFVSLKFRLACKHARLTGYRFVPPAEVIARRDGKPWKQTIRRITKDFQLRFMNVCGSGGSVVGQAGIRALKGCRYCGFQPYSAIRGKLLIRKSKWDGSDFFSVTGYYPVLFTDRARIALEAAKLTNFEAVPIGAIR